MPRTTKAEPSADLHAIGEVAEATGITPETLRIWERRYGRPVAVRLPSGHRRYTQEHITWLRRVAEALAHGHRPHKVLKLDEAELDALLAEAADDPGETEESRRLLDWARDFRGMELRAAFEARWDPKDAIGFLSKRVVPFLRLVGREWADGKLDIRHEHFATEILQDTLRRLRAGYPRKGDRGGALLTTLSGERHGLGLQMAGLLCASLGFPYHILGVDSPHEEIVSAAAELDTAIVGISVSLNSGGVETDRQLGALRRMLPEDVHLIVGGDGARGVRRGPRGVEYAADLESWTKRLTELSTS